jgi:hypothetical protein
MQLKLYHYLRKCPVQNADMVHQISMMVILSRVTQHAHIS